MKAYEEGKTYMAQCAAGVGCAASQAQEAAFGLEALARAESDPSVLIYLQLGQNSGGQNVSAVDAQGTVGTIVTIDPSHQDFGASGKYTLAGVAVHEVHEQYAKNVLYGATRPNTGSYDSIHTNAVRHAEDPVYLASGLLSRTARTPGCNVARAKPVPFSAGQVCF